VDNSIIPLLFVFIGSGEAETSSVGSGLVPCSTTSVTVASPGTGEGSTNLTAVLCVGDGFLDKVSVRSVTDKVKGWIGEAAGQSFVSSPGRLYSSDCTAVTLVRATQNVERSKTNDLGPMSVFILRCISR
jgi:hypothetical protein